jgi:L-fuconolactonase
LCYDLVVRPHQLAAAAYSAAAVPGLTFVLDHAGKPPIASGSLADWADALRAFAARPNTVCKLSGLVTEAAPGAPVAAFTPVADVVLQAFGAERVMFGSDWPVCLLASDYAGVAGLAQALTASLSEAQRESVFSATASRVYGLGERGDAARRWRRRLI